MTLVETRDLVKQFGALTAVDHISFEVPKGTIVGFLGPNGAGKTTTIRMLTCYMPPTSGTATVAGHDVFHDSLAVRENIGAVAVFKAVDVVPALPKTRSGKILRGSIRKIADGETAPVPPTIEDPAALEELRVLFGG